MADNKIDKGQFIQRWAFFPIAQSYKMASIMALSEGFKQRADTFYFSIIKLFPIWRTLRPWVKKYIYFWATEEEKSVMKHTLGQELYRIWLENVGGRKSGFRALVDEKVSFFKYLFKNLHIARHPSFAGVYEDYLNTAFSLKLLRPNIEAHIYLSFPFSLRPLKKFIAQYLEMSVITGDFEMLMRRFPPFHFILNLSTAPGKRTPLDLRGLDFQPIIYKLTIKYNVALELDKIQTRSNNRFVTCLAVDDPKLEQERQGEIRKLENELKGVFPNPGYVTNIDFKNGKVVYVPDGKEIPFYGMRRGRFLQMQSELNLIKAIPRPGSDSGMIVRFQLRHPVAVILEGLNRKPWKGDKREISLDEIEYVWKVIDSLPSIFTYSQCEMPLDSFNKEISGKVMDSINKVFENPEAAGSEETKTILKEVRRLEKEESEERAWDFLIDRLLEGKGKKDGPNQIILQALCLRLNDDAFNAVFSLWPLLTGREISIDQSSGEVRVSEVQKEKVEVEKDWDSKDRVRKIKREKIRKTESVLERGSGKVLLPMLETVKDDMEDLLKNVFAKYVDVSAATIRTRSEPFLSEMIVEYCLNVKADPAKFREKLEKHLTEHYRIHYDFLIGYLQVEPPEIIKKIHKLHLKDGKADWDKIQEQIQADVEGILNHIETTRDRLYSPSGSSRLLCFIDPISVEVRIGDFIFEGNGLEAEEEFISRHEKRQYELAEIKSSKKFEILQLQGKKHFMQIKAEVEQYINERQLEVVFSEVKKEAIEKLKQGNMESYFMLSLIKAHQEGGLGEVEKVLNESTNIVRAIKPEWHKLQMATAAKQALIGILKDNPKHVDKIMLAVMLDKTPDQMKGIVATDIYKEVNELFAKVLQNMRYVMPMSTMPRMTRDSNLPSQGRALEFGTGAENETQTETVEVLPHTDRESGKN
ncbi:MAG: hypothetical protein AB7S75_05115 [Desulfococcaceae bacterium]